MQHGLRNHVIVRDDQAIGRCRKAAAVECAGACVAKEAANLHDGVARAIQSHARRIGKRLLGQVRFHYFRGALFRCGSLGTRRRLSG